MTKLKCSDFAKHVLNTPLWPKQEEILDEYFGGGKSHACWALGRRSGKTLMASIAAVYACFVLEGYYKRKDQKERKMVHYYRCKRSTTGKDCTKQY
jgi:hypothetical protein